ncbi:hypothetical protein V8C35DRAFT_307887 [Trichoderma chlorosporum]
MSGFVEASRSQSPPRRRRACEQCSKAKARCHFPASNPSCERCCKMAISCTEQTNQGLRKPRQIRLQDRIYNRNPEEHQRAISLARTPDEDEIPKQSGDSASVNPSLITTSCTTESSACISVSDSEKEPEAGFNSQQAHSLPQRPQGTQLFNIPWQQADEILHVFQQKYMHHFPFVVLENGMSACQLEQRQPFTFKAIMLIATPIPWLMTAAMRENFFAHLGQRLFTEKEFDLDLLQCVLLCIAWADLCDLGAHQITNFTYTALGYAHNLAAFKKPRGVRQCEDNLPGNIISAKSPAEIPELRAIDAHRAFLGCVSVLSADSTRLDRQNPLGGPFVDVCRSLLRQHPECPSDFVLERHVRLIQLNDKISETFSTNFSHNEGEARLSLIEDVSRRLRPELDGIMESLGFDQQQFRWPSIGNVSGHEKSFKLAYYYLIVRLYEPTTRFGQAAVETEDASLDLRRRCLTNCMSATRAYFEHLLGPCPDGWYSYQSAIAMKPIIFMMIVAARLLSIDLPGWNAKPAYPEFDLSSIIDRFVSQLEEAEEALKQDNEKFAHSISLGMKPNGGSKSKRLAELAKRAKSVKKWYETRMVGVIVDGRHGDETRDSVAIAEDERSVAEIWWSRQPRWFNGLYENSTWNFDDMEG